MGAEANISTGKAQEFFSGCFFCFSCNTHILADKPSDQQHGLFLTDVCQKTVISDFHKAKRQDMEQESADKLHTGKRHLLCLVIMAAVFIAEGHPVIFLSLLSCDLIWQCGGYNVQDIRALVQVL